MSESDAGVSLEFDRRINFAMQQNDVPVVKRLRVENRTSAPLRDLQVRVWCEPEFAAPWSTQIATIAEQSTYNIDAVDLELSPGFLGELTERVRGQLHVAISHEGRELGRIAESVELLARDEWSGLSSLPEILAAFVMPNHPANEPVMRSAADLLGVWTKDPSLNGYQSKDRRRAYQMAGAIHEALRRCDLTYVNPPASFEDEGQRVRLPDRVFESRMATCLDVALVAAACLEQAGLHPLLVLVDGHAFAGVWLLDETFPEPAIEDGLRLRKRVDLQEIAVFDSTAVTARPSLTFEASVSEAKRRLADGAQFRCVIDVARARKGRVRPLPERVVRPTTSEVGEAPRDPAAPAPSLTGIPNPLPEVIASPESPVETPASRLDRWKRKLLDLSLRNRLLNFKDSKKTLQFLCPDLSQLEDMLAGGTTFQIKPRPGDLAGADPRDTAAHRRRTGEEAPVEVLREELRAHRLHSNTSSEELERRLVEIYRAARLGLEEGGASALYLAVGFLSWYETETSSEPRIAPILLIPVELHRKSILEGFTLQQGDDEPRVNVTLLEMLKQDKGLVIPRLDPLPEDDSGLDVPLILRTVRQAIRDIDRWDVLDDVRLGLFSFTKFLMWRDLSERASDLMRNAIVDHLVNRPNEAFDASGSFPSADRLDEHRAPTETFCPLPADSSQLAAVISAAEGRSFVIEGPPGTGKSQTITNLIAHCLTEGKTVLFVSEKMAALNVVKKRLEGVGLGRYCLELHSNKAHKREVVSQLERALQHTEALDEGEWSREAARLSELRKNLNAYASALHRKRSTGETIFQATSRLIGLRNVPRVDLRWASPEDLGADEIAALRDLVDRLTTAASECRSVSDHAWRGVRHEDWSFGWQEEVARAVASLAESADALETLARACSERLGFGEGGWSSQTLDLMRDVTLSLMDSPAPPVALTVRSDWDAIQDRIGAWIEHGQARDRLRASMRKGYRDEITTLDLDDLRARAKSAETSWWPASWWRERPVRTALRGVALDGKAPARDRLGDVLRNAIALRDEQRRLDGASEEARELLGRHWNDGEAEWGRIAKVRDWSRGLRSLALRAAGDDFDRAARLRERWAQMASDGRELLAPIASIGREFVAYGRSLDAFKAAKQRAAQLLDLDVEALWGVDQAADLLGRVRSSTSRWRDGSSRVREWCAWRRTRSEAMHYQLAPLVEAHERGELRSDQLRPVFERSYTQWWLAAVSDPEPVLSQFFSPEHERRIVQFREADDRYMKLTRSVIQARLNAKVPASSAAALPNSEMGILKREIARKRGFTPVRQLFQRIPNLLPRLKPCLLMSPMSVAQYLDAAFPPFDIVVFDEASQIPVWDAVGAIARGRQAVIVGDPKQLPPTSFFQRGEDDEEPEAEDVVEDLESILDDCIGAQIPWLPLDWHYRSRHESLITFSNYHYYGNRLLTFPSATVTGMGVAWRAVPGGIYDKGKTRTNRAEADAVVTEVVRRLRDPELSKFSLGVVTFSQAQQTLIEDLLDQARAASPDLDRCFAEDAEEPVFVKNLENVQGDERDVILFSICYGPDGSGRPVSMNFGPMNRDGGHRRLNVAITRARREVIVFSTLTADQIDLARTRARGVQDLKAFLAYAEHGPAAIAEATQLDMEADFDSPFEEAVYSALAARGWEVRKQVGCARYRIDLAVVDPALPGRFLLGVECDGANYHRAKTARDRDKLREGILRDLGWKLHRIWSTDWWADPDREIAKLEAALEQAKTAPKELQSTESPVSGAAPGQAVDGSPSTPDLPRARPADTIERYRPLHLGRLAGSQAEFYEGSSNERIKSQILAVVTHDGPVSLALVARWVAAHWGFERVRQPALERIRSLIPRGSITIRVSGGGEFLWLREIDPDQYASFRIPSSDGDGARATEDLPIEELANAALYVVREHVGAPVEEVVREVARLFAFQRTGRVVEERITSGLEMLIERGKVVRSDSGLVAV